MDLRQLECFMAVCRELHFSRAAETLHISQPALSQHIKNLEARVGMPLFDRLGRRTALTEAGEILLAHTRRIFHEMEQARAAIQDLSGLERGRLTIGALFTSVSYLVTPAVLKFKALYPNIELSVLGLRARRIRTKLLENELDLGIMYLPLDDDELESVPLFTEELAMAVAAGHPLARAGDAGAAELENVTMIVPPENHLLRQMTDDYFAEHGVSPSTVLEMSPLDALGRMVADGIGAAILPAPYIEYLSDPRIVRVRLAHPAPRRQMGMVYRKHKFMCAATRTFIQQLSETGAGLGIPREIREEAKREAP